MQLRTPTAQASGELTNAINASLAALRGWMLTGNPAFKTERAAVWSDIDTVSAEMDQLSSKWTNPDNVTAWNELKAVIAEFRDAQAQVETVARSQDEQPASKMLLEQAAPRAAVMSKNITTMIDLELAEVSDGTVAGGRVRLLGMMADVRGTLGLALANIRAYLLTGNQTFVEKFNALWAKNERRFNDLTSAAHLLTKAQRTAFDEFASVRGEFAPLPARMFEIRGSKKWNMANYLLVTEAAPRAGRILDTLTGEKQADGSRHGGMKANQRALLQADAVAGAESVALLLKTQWVLLFVGIGLAAAIAWLTARALAKPIREMIGAMTGLAEGNLDTDVPAKGRRDEIGEMAQAVQVFKDNAIRTRELEAEQAAAASKQEAATRKVMLDVADKFEQSIGEIVDTVSGASSELNATAQSLASISEETNSQAGVVSHASQDASSKVQAVAAAAEQMSKSIGEIGRQVSEASHASRKAVDEVANTADQMSALTETADKIGNVISMISEIADQTNLLALNATIESARAGEAGKGFAVVAGEVKELASQTAKATDTIAQHISEIQAATNAAVASMEQVGTTIREVDTVSSNVSAVMDEQGSATQEIARNVQDVADRAQDVSNNIEGVTQASQETSAATSQVTAAVSELDQQSNRLRDEVSSFLGGLRQKSADRRERDDPGFTGPDRRQRRTQDAAA